MSTVERTRVRMLAAAALWACGVPAGASPVRPPTLAGRLDLILEKQDPAAPGLSLIVIEDGAVVYQRSKGVADLARNTPITQDTVFALGTATEIINVIALTQLIDRGRLTRSRSIGRMLPGLPRAIAAIRAGELLDRHQSLQLPLAQRERTFASLIARASGRSYAQYLAEHIFAPAGMAASYVSGQPAPRPQDEALGFGREPDRSLFDVHSSAADMGRLMQAFWSRTLVRQPFDLLDADASEGFRHFVYGTGARGLYTVVLANSGAQADKLIANIFDTVQEQYLEPMPQM